MKDLLNTVTKGDCLEVLKKLPDNSIDSLVTDPPYAFDPITSKTWDGADPRRDEKDKASYQQRIANGVNYKMSLDAYRRFQGWVEEWARELYRVLKPGAHGFVFASDKTLHRMNVGLEEAGFEIRGTLIWGYATGTPKGNRDITNDLRQQGVDAEDGMGTVVKPAYEPFTLIRKPISEKTVALNVLKHGTGALYIDEGRIPWEKPPAKRKLSSKDAETIVNKAKVVEAHPGGRWPATIVLTDEILGDWNKFFMIPKPNKAEKTHGGQIQNEHSTIKPTNLMSQCIRMVTPKGGIVLDLFAGSGTTLVSAKQLGHPYIGIEREAKSVKTALDRLGVTNAEV